MTKVVKQKRKIAQVSEFFSSLGIWKTSVVLFGTILISSLGLYACSRPGTTRPDFKDKDVHLTILQTSDIHSRILSYRLTPLRTDQRLGLNPDKGPFGGIARISTIVKQERARSDRAIHLDSGDLFQGAPIFNVFQGEPELRTISAIGMDAYVLGNHDFDNGGLVLSRQIALWSTLPMLAANYVYLNDSRRRTSDQLRKLTQPYVILNVKGFRVGVIGLANTSSLTSLAEGGNSLGITATEPNMTAQAYVNIIKDKVDFVVILTHIGLTEDEKLITGYHRHTKVKKYDPKTGLSEFERKWIKGVCDVDVIVGGHHHVVLNPSKILIEREEDCPHNKGKHREVLLVHSGAFAKFVGRLDVVIRNGEVRSHRYQVTGVTSETKEDPEILRILEPYALTLNQQIDTTRVFAYAPYLVPRFGRGTGDSSLGNMVSTAMKDRRRVEADFSLTNSLGIRTDMQAGPISLEQLYEIFPFENTLATLFLSGREVKEMLDFVTARSSGRGCQSQAQVAGISFVMNCKKRQAESICVGGTRNPLCRDIPEKDRDKAECFDPLAKDGPDGKPNPKTCVYGRPIKEFTSYKLAANDYIAKGGSGFKVLQRNTTQFNTGVSLRDALIEFIESLPSCKEANAKRKAAGLPPHPVPKKYEGLPCILSDEDGRIRRRLN
mgnify:CR=1 FL=1